VETMAFAVLAAVVEVMMVATVTDAAAVVVVIARVWPLTAVVLVSVAVMLGNKEVGDI